MSEPRLCIASHAADSDYAPTSRVLLWKLGYALVPAAEANEPSLRVVRDDRLGEVAATPGRADHPAHPRTLGAARATRASRERCGARRDCTNSTG